MPPGGGGGGGGADGPAPLGPPLGGGLEEPEGFFSSQPVDIARIPTRASNTKMRLIVSPKNP